jgi:hypothetical protein
MNIYYIKRNLKFKINKVYFWKLDYIQYILPNMMKYNDNHYLRDYLRCSSSLKENTVYTFKNGEFIILNCKDSKPNILKKFKKKEELYIQWKMKQQLINEVT